MIQGGKGLVEKGVWGRGAVYTTDNSSTEVQKLKPKRHRRAGKDTIETTSTAKCH